MTTKKQKQSPPKKSAFKLKPWHYLLLVLVPAIVYGSTVIFDYVMHDDDILEADPNNLHGIFNLGVAYKEANQLNEAIETFSLLISKKPDFPNAYYERGFSYGKMGLFPQAKFDLDESIKYQPQHGPSYFFRGRAYEGVGKIGPACEDWKKALELGVAEAQEHIQQKCR